MKKLVSYLQKEGVYGNHSYLVVDEEPKNMFHEINIHNLNGRFAQAEELLDKIGKMGLEGGTIENRICYHWYYARRMSFQYRHEEANKHIAICLKLCEDTVPSLKVCVHHC